MATPFNAPMGPNGIPDANADVALGQAGTGDAVIYKDSIDPMAIWREAEMKKAALAAKAAELHLKQKQAYQDKGLWANDLVKNAWTQDVTGSILPSINNYTNYLGNIYKQKGRDPSDPRDPEFAKVKQMEDELLLKANASSQHKKAYEDALKELNGPNGDKYDREASLKALEDFRNTPLDSRLTAQSPVLTPAFDLGGYLGKNLKELDPSQTANAGISADEKYVYNNTTATHDAGQIAQMAKNALSYAPARAALQKEYDALPDDEKQSLWLEGYAKNKIQGLNYVKRTSSVSQGPYYSAWGQGKEENTAAADRLLQLAAGLKEGNPNLFQTDGKWWGASLLPDTQNSQAVGTMKLGQVQYPDSKGNLQTKPNMIKGWKRMDGKLYIQDTRAEVEKGTDGKKKYPNGMRPVNDMWTEFIEPYVKENFPSNKQNEVLEAIKERAKEGYDIDLNGGAFGDDDYKRIYKKPLKTFSKGQKKLSAFD